MYTLINDTLASNTDEAVERTDLNVTIPGATNYNSMTPVGVGPTDDFYTVSRVFTWNDGPQEGITYVVTAKYQVRIVA